MFSGDYSVLSKEEFAQLSSTDVYNAFRLIEKLRETDGIAWRELLCTELPQCVDASLATSYLFKINLDPADLVPRTLTYKEVGTNQFWKRYIAEGDVTTNPMTPPIMQHLGTDFCVRRRDWVTDEVWYSSQFYKEVLQHADWDFAIYSQVGITPPGVVDGLSVARPLGKPDFTPREVAIVKLVHQELARIWRNDGSLPVHKLPARQRQVLEGIRQGQSRKKIAESLELSEHTVHSYEKALFAFANVSSRTELLAILNKAARPALMP